jgi:hypothetical protein
VHEAIGSIPSIKKKRPKKKKPPNVVISAQQNAKRIMLFKIKI